MNDAVAVCVKAGELAVIVTVRLTVTGIVTTEKVADLCPEGILMDDGAGAIVALSDRKLMSTPPMGAGSPIVTVPLAELPPITVLFVRVS